MPELPEVEVTRLSFADRIAGAQVASVRLGKPLRWALGCDPAALAGRRVQAVRRRGKYLLMDLDTGLLLLHLGMSGSLRFALDAPAPGAHDHFDMVTNRGMALTLASSHDRSVRRVGELRHVASSTKGRVWAVAFACAARCARVVGPPCIGQSV